MEDKEFKEQCKRLDGDYVENPYMDTNVPFCYLGRLI
jgi:hypothetical protein